MFKTFGFYAQDDYRATNRLTLNLGLRYEYQTPFHELYGRETTLLDIQHSGFVTTCATCQMDDPSYRNFSPRVGLAWDVFGTGKTSVRSGFGIYYDVGIYGAMLTQVPTGFPPFSAQTNLTFPSTSAQPTFNQSATPMRARFSRELLDHIASPLQFHRPTKAPLGGTSRGTTTT